MRAKLILPSLIFAGLFLIMVAFVLIDHGDSQANVPQSTPTPYQERSREVSAKGIDVLGGPFALLNSIQLCDERIVLFYSRTNRIAGAFDINSRRLLWQRSDVVSFSFDGQNCYLSTIGASSVEVMKSDSGEALFQVTIPPDCNVRTMSPHSALAVLHCGEDAARIVSLIEEFGSALSERDAGALATAEGYVAICRAEQRGIQFIDTSLGKEGWLLNAFTYIPSRIDINNNGICIAASSFAHRDGTFSSELVIWSGPDNQVIFRKNSDKMFGDVFISERYVAYSEGSSIRIYALSDESIKEITQYSGHPKHYYAPAANHNIVSALCLDPANMRGYSADFGGQLHVWEFDDADVLHQ